MLPNNDLFGTVVEVRNVELQSLWTRFNIHLLVNGGFLVTFVTAQDKPLLQSAGKWPYYFGLLFSILWLCSEISGRISLHHRDKKISDFETNFWMGTLLEKYLFFRETPWYLRLQMFVSILFILLIIFAWVFLLNQYKPAGNVG